MLELYMMCDILYGNEVSDSVCSATAVLIAFVSYAPVLGRQIRRKILRPFTNAGCCMLLTRLFVYCP